MEGKRNLYYYYFIIVEGQRLGGSAMPKKAGCEDGVVVVNGVDDADGEVEDCSWQLFEKRKVVGTNLLPTLFLKIKTNISAIHSNWQREMRLLLANSPASPMKIFIINFHGNEK